MFDSAEKVDEFLIEDVSLLGDMLTESTVLINNIPVKKLKKIKKRTFGNKNFHGNGQLYKAIP